MSPVQLEMNMKEKLRWQGTACYRQVVHLALYFWFLSGCFNFGPCQLHLHIEFRRNIQEKMDTLGGRLQQLSLNGMAAEGFIIIGKKCVLREIICHCCMTC